MFFNYVIYIFNPCFPFLEIKNVTSIPIFFKNTGTTSSAFYGKL
jgi:hypothetical protein